MFIVVMMGNKVVCCYDDKYSKPVQIYRGENAVHQFMESMLEEVKGPESATPLLLFTV